MVLRNPGLAWATYLYFVQTLTFLLCFLGEFFNFDFQVFSFTLLILNAMNSLCRHVHTDKRISNMILCISMKIYVYSQANIDCGLSVAVFLVLSCKVF